MHIVWLRYAGLPWLLDVPHQEFDAGERFSPLAWLDAETKQPLVIASGLSVGKEGPSVHVACTIGNLVASQFSRFSRSQSEPSRTRLKLTDPWS